MGPWPHCETEDVGGHRGTSTKHGAACPYGPAAGTRTFTSVAEREAHSS